MQPTQPIDNAAAWQMKHEVVTAMLADILLIAGAQHRGLGNLRDNYVHVPKGIVDLQSRTHF